MKQLLHIKSSIFSAHGQSSQLAAELLSALQDKHSEFTLIERDLAQQPIPHLNAEHVQAFFAAESDRTPEQQAVVAFSDALIAEIQQAELIVIGLPLYNFGIPSTLKAYFDQIARAGITFRYTEHGPEGLLQGKKVIIIATRGGKYSGTALDSQTDYMRNFLGFLGLTDITWIYAEGLNMHEHKAESLVLAKQQLQALAADI